VCTKNCSSFVRIVSLVLDVCKRWEGPCTEAVKLILEEHDLFLLLLDHIDHLTLIGDGHDALLRVRSCIVVRGGLEIDDLLSLVDLHAQVTSLAL